MNSRIIRLPDIGEGITEVEIVEWHVSIGDVVAEDQSIGSVMTDKAAVEIPSPVAGVVEALSGQVGDVLSVGAEYARIRMNHEVSDEPEPEPAEKSESVRPAGTGDSMGRDLSDIPAIARNAEQASSALTANPLIDSENEWTNSRGNVSESRLGQKPPISFKPAASPAVRRHAYRLDIALSEVQGSGPGGRILHEDLDRHLAEPSIEVASDTTREVKPGSVFKGLSGAVDEIRVVGMRRAIARKMQTAKQHIPHFSYVEEIDVTELESLRLQLNERSGSRHARLTLLPFIVLATVRSLAEFPRMNARYDDDAEIIRQYHEVHLGIATQTDKGLMVPVLRQAHCMDLRSLATAISHLAEAAREGNLAVADTGAGTITVTSLGTLGGLVSTPVINYPEVAIVGVNRIVTRPMFQGDQVVPRQLMNLSCSFDHRVVDGYDAAKYVQCIKGYLEFPASLFVPV